ncbi:DUF2742 domain-containing protein [Gordonia paraffinivorans]|uniref:DUF2742 domain-containing protein n=1 Tax=Gordonia paraffinivorans TaxID=175628 RepID=UPI0014455968|nr:DUF2742 domain-containing protein [Gordonia paraffinivorans]
MASLTYDQANQLRYRLAGIELPETVDRAQLNALLTAGVRAVLEQELEALEDRCRAVKDAAVEVSGAVDWSAQARRIRDRADARRSGAYIDRHREEVAL